jgi:hypothetical protein
MRNIARALEISLTSVWRICAAVGLSRLRPPAEPIKRYERDQPGDLLHMDTKKLMCIGGRGSGHEVMHVAIDDHSRVAFVQILPDETKFSAIAFLKAAIDYFERQRVHVKRLLTDNGSAYWSRDFAAACAELEIKQRFTRPYRPQTNGKAERFIQTCLREWVRVKRYATNQDRTKALKPWLKYYNNERPHSALNYQPPASRLPNNVLKHNRKVQVRRASWRHFGLRAAPVLVFRCREHQLTYRAGKLRAPGALRTLVGARSSPRTLAARAIAGSRDGGTPRRRSCGTVLIVSPPVFMRTCMTCARIAFPMRRLRSPCARLLVLVAAWGLALAGLDATAQASPAAVQVVPAAPTSAETVTLRIARTCGGTRYITPTTAVSNSSAGLRVLIHTQNALPPACEPASAQAPPLLVELGQLPAGSYTLSVIDRRIVTFEFVDLPVANNVAFTVSDRRAQAPVPVTRLNYSDHWWDASDLGAGFMIWHSTDDELLLVWFAYGPDGKPVWTTLQGGRWVSPTRYDGPMVQTSRAPSLPGSGFPVTSATSGVVIGTATLDFNVGDGVNTARFSTRLTGSTVDVVRNLRRFGK